VPKGLEPLHHQLAAAETAVAQAAKLGLKLVVRGIHPVGQHVDAGSLVLGGQLDTGDDLDPELGTRSGGLVETLGGVVVGDGHALEPTLGGELYDRPRRERTVRAVRVHVQIDAGHGSRSSQPAPRASISRSSRGGAPSVRRWPGVTAAVQPMGIAGSPLR
jgi:hypothetical protein